MHLEASLSLNFALPEIAPSNESMLPPFLESPSYTCQCYRQGSENHKTRPVISMGELDCIALIL